MSCLLLCPVSEPKLLIGTEAIEPEDLEPRKIELDRILWTDPCQEGMDELGKVGAEMSYIESDYDSTEALQTRILKMENNEKCRLHH